METAGEVDPDCNRPSSMFNVTNNRKKNTAFEPMEEAFITLKSENKEHGLYPVNTFEAPSHTPGNKHLGSPHSHVVPVDYSQYDIVKATQYGIMDRVKHFIEVERYDVRQPDHENVTLLHWASINNRLELVQYLINKGSIIDQPGGHLNATALHWAIRQGHLDICILLIKYGADPTIEDSEGCSGIHLAAQFGHSPVCAYLIAKGVDVDLCDQNGMTPLMWSSYRCFGVDPTRLILNFGAAVNFADSIHKNTALHWAISSSNTNVVKPLLKGGASLDCVNAQGETPLELAINRKNNWIVHHLKDEQFRRGVGRPGFVNTLSNDPIMKRKFLIIMSAAPLFLIGFILQYSPWWVYTIFMLTILSGFINAGMRLFFDSNNPIALGLYIGTKSYMLTTLFLYFWPLINDIRIHIVFWTQAACLSYCFYKCWYGDPGYIKTSPSKQKKEILELAEAKMLNDFSKFCTTCLTRKPIRSKHCSICNRCVARMDHHCPWIDNCVGYKNHAHFVGFLFFLFFMNIWYVWATLMYYNTYCVPFEEGILIAAIKAFTCAPWVSWGFCMACFHSVWVCTLLSCSVYQVLWLGMTTNERMNAPRYKHFHEKSTGNIKSPFGNGVLQNTADFFNISFFGFIRPRQIDWMNEYEVRDFNGPQDNWRRYEHV